MVHHLDQPYKHGVGIDFEHPGDGADAQAFRQRAHRPHQLLGRDAFAMERRAVGLLEIALASRAVELPPRAAARMTIRTEIAPAHPASIVAVRMGAAMLRGVHLAWPSPAGSDRRRGEGGGQSRWFLRRLRTGRTVGLACETRKRRRVPGGLARGAATVGGPAPMAGPWWLRGGAPGAPRGGSGGGPSRAGGAWAPRGRTGHARGCGVSERWAICTRKGGPTSRLPNAMTERTPISD